MCAIASAELFRRLYRAKHRNIKLVETCVDWGGAHCFVLFDDRYILDVTATQFDVLYKDITIIDTFKRRIDEVPYYWQVQNTFSSVYQLKKYQQETNWPRIQQPR
jgi:hypothetical protein